MKKTISILLVMLLLASLGSFAFAEEDTVDLPFEDCGFTMHVPASFNESVGLIIPSPYGELDYVSKIYCTEYYYVSMTPEEYNDYSARIDDLTEDEIAFVRDSIKVLFSVISVGNGGDFSAVVKFFTDYGSEVDAAYATELAKADNFTFYRYDEPEPPFPDSTDPFYLEEYAKLRDTVDQGLANADYYAPVSPYAGLDGKVLSFETTDIDGNPVKSEELFGQHQYTMLNIWASWCGPCIRELPELQEINGRIAADDCAVVGLLYDSANPGAVETARGIIEENGVSYTVILAPENIDDLLEIDLFPTTVFVDRSGTIAGSPVIGAKVSAYEPALQSLLAGEAQESSSPAASPNSEEVYRVIVTDSDGNPVKGVGIKFCDDSTCTMQKTDADGIASFALPEGIVYEVHLLKTPEGYEENSDAYYSLETYSDVSIVLIKAA